jgi:hypothetical protein
MITIIFDKPIKSVDVSSYGVKSYKTKEGETIYKVYGVVTEPQTARLVPTEGTTASAPVQNLFLGGNEVVIFRSVKEEEAVACKDVIDSVIARGGKVFPIKEYKQMVQQNKHEANLFDNKEQKDYQYTEPTDTVVTANAN